MRFIWGLTVWATLLFILTLAAALIIVGLVSLADKANGYSLNARCYPDKQIGIFVDSFDDDIAIRMTGTEYQKYCMEGK